MVNNRDRKGKKINSKLSPAFPEPEKATSLEEGVISVGLLNRLETEIIRNHELLSDLALQINFLTTLI